MQPKFYARFLSFLLVILFNAQVWGQFFYCRDLPQLYYRLDWNTATSSYDSAYKFLATYDVNGRLIQRDLQELDSTGAWVSTRRREVRYVQFPDSMITDHSLLIGNNWVIASREVLTKDSDGRVTSELTYMGNSSPAGISLNTGTRYQYALDANGRLESVLVFSYDNHLATWWQFQWIQYQFTTGNIPETALTSIHTNNGWQPFYRDLNIQWHNFNRLKANSFIRQGWNGSGYENLEKHACTWGPYEYIRCTTERWINNAWAPYSRDKQLLDSQDHYTYTGNDLHDGTNWNTNYWTRFRNTYSGGLLAESEAFDWALDTTFVVPLYKYVFINYALSSPAEAQENTLLAFPQPARDRVYVQSDLRGPLQLRLYDLQGRLLIQQAGDAAHLSEKGLDVSHVPDGLYLLQVASSKSNHTLRIKVLH